MEFVIQASPRGRTNTRNKTQSRPRVPPFHSAAIPRMMTIGQNQVLLAKIGMIESKKEFCSVPLMNRNTATSSDSSHDTRARLTAGCGALQHTNVSPTSLYGSDYEHQRQQDAGAR